MDTTMFDDLESNTGGQPVKEIKRAAPKKQVKAGDDWVEIVLEENDNIPPTGQFFQLNGEAFIIKPGERVRVPRGIISILNDAVMSTPILDSGNTVIGYRDRLRFPYRHFGAAA